MKTQCRQTKTKKKKKKKVQKQNVQSEGSVEQQEILLLKTAKGIKVDIEGMLKKQWGIGK